ncbi:hypothetical protein SNEBB_007656 [Seison nebaliae]|nr:hypothetical protein SNEBB_007656 [Seison nebaliae]
MESNPRETKSKKNKNKFGCNKEYSKKFESIDARLLTHNYLYSQISSTRQNKFKISTGWKYSFKEIYGIVSRRIIKIRKKRLGEGIVRHPLLKYYSSV